MSGSFPGSFPGGPRRRDEGDPPPDAPRTLESVRTLESRAAALTRGRAHRARRKRLVWGLIASVVVAGAVGSYMGYRAHSSPAEIVEEQEQARDQRELSDEVDRALVELWRMEAVEAARNQGVNR